MNLLSEYLSFLHEEDSEKKTTWKDKAKKYGKAALGVAAAAGLAYGGYKLKKNRDANRKRIVDKYKDDIEKQKRKNRDNRLASQKKKKNDRDAYNKKLQASKDARDKAWALRHADDL